MRKLEMGLANNHQTWFVTHLTFLNNGCCKSKK